VFDLDMYNFSGSRRCGESYEEEITTQDLAPRYCLFISL